MENFNFKFKNGKFVMVESYGHLREEEEQTDDAKADTAKPADAKKTDAPKSDEKPDTAAKLLKSLGMSTEEATSLIDQIEKWGQSGAGKDTVIAFESTKLRDGLDDEGGGEEDSPEDSPGGDGDGEEGEGREPTPEEQQQVDTATTTALAVATPQSMQAVNASVEEDEPIQDADIIDASFTDLSGDPVIDMVKEKYKELAQKIGSEEELEKSITLFCKDTGTSEEEINTPDFYDSFVEWFVAKSKQLKAGPNKLALPAPSSGGGGVNPNAVGAAIAQAASKGRVGAGNAIDKNTAIQLANAYNEFLKKQLGNLKEGAARADVARLVNTFLAQYQGGKYSKMREVVDALTDATLKANVQGAQQAGKTQGTDQKVDAAEKDARMDQATAPKAAPTQQGVPPKTMAPDTRTPEQKKAAEDADRARGRTNKGGMTETYVRPRQIRVGIRHPSLVGWRAR